MILGEREAAWLDCWIVGLLDEGDAGAVAMLSAPLHLQKREQARRSPNASRIRWHVGWREAVGVRPGLPALLHALASKPKQRVAKSKSAISANQNNFLPSPHPEPINLKRAVDSNRRKQSKQRQRGLSRTSTVSRIYKPGETFAQAGLSRSRSLRLLCSLLFNPTAAFRINGDAIYCLGNELAPDRVSRKIRPGDDLSTVPRRFVID